MSAEFLASAELDFNHIVESGEFSEQALLDDLYSISVIFNDFTVDTNDLKDQQSEISANRISVIINKKQLTISGISEGSKIEIRNIEYTVVDINQYDQYCLLVTLMEID